MKKSILGWLTRLHLAQLLDSKWLTEFLFGPPIDPKMRVLLTVNDKIEWEFTVGDSLTTTLITGSTESGKTTKLKMVLLAMLKARYGGLVLTVKGSLPRDIREVAQLAGREDDLIFLNPKTGANYNPFELANSAAEGAAMLAEVARAIQSKAPEGVSEDQFWSELRDVQVRKLCTVCLHIHGRLSITDLAKLHQGLPGSPDQWRDPEWQRTSLIWSHLTSALSAQDEEVKKSTQFLLNRPSVAHSKLQDSVNSLITVLLDRLDSEPLNRVFVNNGSIRMEDVLNRQKILVVDMPLLESDSGRIANLLIQHCFMKAASQPKRHGEAFMLCDEFHHTVTPEFSTFISHQREALVAPILATQNLMLLEEKIGKTSTLALCGNAVTKIFCRQDDHATRTWASELIGKEMQTRYNHSRDDKGSRSTSSHDERDFHIQPEELTTMKIEEAIILRKGVWLKTKWPKRPNGKEGTVRIVSG